MQASAAGSGRDEMADALTELLKTGAQALIASAVETELAGYMEQFSELRTEAGQAAVVRNGYHPARPFQTGIGPVSVRIPKVRSQDGTPVTFRSALVPPYVRRTKTLEAALPWLYLKGISSGEMGVALKVLLGPDATGLSANTVSRLKYYLSGACKHAAEKAGLGQGIRRLERRCGR
jgi:transposase-like protein